ncbi:MULTISPECIES: flavin reductase family protein [Rhizobium]|uniref:Flavin reductase n=2 Tax=Rhizobium TaxID=379 RepID=A0A2A5KXM4_9HYPH|nr:MULTISPECIES: flavin reductase family protein [Rhizobium]UWU38239.1 flavin reductase family protein [Rhizobium leguminosarum bv. phaseoli]ARQ61530.1 flavin reductase-like protein [Rhizobium sp. Kim5]PCK81721.1 flavin reductase [Rhizobium sophoriradicis]PCK86894.1 flavin reductase [Rhizobium sophoriradicis]RSB92057.1 flavin reductase [Rhizobium sophoriradicis]
MSATASIGVVPTAAPKSAVTLAHPMISDAFRSIMRRFPATVTVISACRNGADHGMTATAVTSLSMEPPSLVICLNNRTYLHDMLLEAPEFAVNVLTDRQVAVSEGFSGKVAPELRFDSSEWVRHGRGMMVLETAHASVVCRRMGAVPYGTHTIFIGQVIDTRLSEATVPLMYENASYCAPRHALSTSQS